MFPRQRFGGDHFGGAGPPLRPLDGGDDEAGGHGWKIGTQAALVRAFAKAAKVGRPRLQAK